jgi:hypothetical protein
MSKVPDFGLNKMAGDFWRDGEKAAIAYRGDSLDFPVVVFDEFQMGDQGRKILPSGKGFGVNQDPVQLAIGFDVRIYFLGDSPKVSGLQRSLGTNNQNAFLSKKLVIHHGWYPFEIDAKVA